MVVTGLGLPTISMGLLAIVMPPTEAAAILILPSFITIVWQMLAGPASGTVVRAASSAFSLSASACSISNFETRS